MCLGGFFKFEIPSLYDYVGSGAGIRKSAFDDAEAFAIAIVAVAEAELAKAVSISVSAEATAFDTNLL